MVILFYSDLFSSFQVDRIWKVPKCRQGPLEGGEAVAKHRDGGLDLVVAVEVQRALWGWKLDLVAGSCMVE